MITLNKTYVGQNSQIVTHLQTIESGDEIQLEGLDRPSIPNEPEGMPWGIRLSTNAIYDTLIHFGTKDSELRDILQNKLLESEHGVWPTNHFRLMAKSNTKVEWGIEESNNQTSGDIFTVEDNAVKVPMNSDIEDRKYKILNSGLLDDDQFCPSVMNQVRPPRPLITKYKNDCNVLCVTFMPTGPEGFSGSNYKEQGWLNGAHFMWEDDSENFTIRKKGTVDYLVPIHGVDVLNSNEGNRIPAGVPIQLTTDSIDLAPSTNIILHIYR